MVIYLVQIEPKIGFETEKVKDGYRHCGYLPQPPKSPVHKEQEKARAGGLFVDHPGYYKAFWQPMPNPFPRKRPMVCARITISTGLDDP